MEITNTNWHFYVDDIQLYELAQSKGIAIDDMPYSMVASLAIPYDLYTLLQEKARLETIQAPTDEYLIQWAKENCQEFQGFIYNQSLLNEVRDRLSQYTTP